MRRRKPGREADERRYRVAAKVFLAGHRECARCHRRASQVHHMAGRDGYRLLYRPWWLPVCAWCHHWITEHPAEAVEQGFSRSRHSVVESPESDEAPVAGDPIRND